MSAPYPEHHQQGLDEHPPADEHPADEHLVDQYTVRVWIFGSTITGPVRADNQDAIVVASGMTTTDRTSLAWDGVAPAAGVAAAVIDGMGGHAGGAEAAALTATALARIGRPDEQQPPDWDLWFEQLSQRVAQAGDAWGLPGMGATAAVLLVTPQGLQMANVGDCRIYRVVGDHVGQLSVDDRSDLGSSTVTQAIGGDRPVDAHGWHQQFKGGFERYVLCTDGVWDTLDPAVLRDLCTADRPPAQIVEAVLSSARAQQSDDNCSIVVVELLATRSAPDEATNAPEVSQPVMVVGQP